MELYYYTSTDTMRYILKQGDIYATNIRYMNDSQEYLNGLEELYKLAQEEEAVVKKWIEEKGYNKGLFDKIQNAFSEDNLKENRQKMEYYSISFCKKNDLLSQWAIYARESGVSIKMNFETEEYRFLTESVEENHKSEWKLFPKDVYYFTRDSMKGKDSDQYIQTAKQLLNELYLKGTKDSAEWKKERWRYISTLVKRYDFYQEEESRLVFDPNAPQFPPCIQYRSDKKVLKPYLDVECEGGWPVWEIMVGPGFNQQIVYNSIEHFLQHVDAKVGIQTAEQYINRMKKYLEPCRHELEPYSDYKELEAQFEDKQWLQEVGPGKTGLEEAKYFLVQKMQALRKKVCEGDRDETEVKKYFMDRHFTKSGVILTKSDIPYIF